MESLVRHAIYGQCFASWLCEHKLQHASKRVPTIAEINEEEKQARADEGCSLEQSLCLIVRALLYRYQGVWQLDRSCWEARIEDHSTQDSNMVDKEACQVVVQQPGAIDPRT